MGTPWVNAVTAAYLVNELASERASERVPSGSSLYSFHWHSRVKMGCLIIIFIEIVGAVDVEHFRQRRSQGPLSSSLRRRKREDPGNEVAFSDDCSEIVREMFGSLNVT